MKKSVNQRKWGKISAASVAKVGTQPNARRGQGAAPFLAHPSVDKGEKACMIITPITK